ncbi:MAG: hypothetical protein QW589_07915 [Candidatus Bathyarchaeia archaeon]
MDGINKGQKEKGPNGSSNHTNSDLARPHESLYPQGERIKVIVEKGHSEGVKVFTAETEPSEKVFLSLQEIGERNPNRKPLCLIALGPYKTLNMWSYINRAKPLIGIGINREYGFLNENNLKTLYLAVRKALNMLKKGKVSQNGQIHRNVYVYNKEEKRESLKVKPLKEVHGTIRQCCLCFQEPIVKTVTETKTETGKPLQLINYFCQDHWQREKPKKLYTTVISLKKEKENIETVKDLYQCDICKAQGKPMYFATFQDLEGHIKTIHTHQPPTTKHGINSV